MAQTRSRSVSAAVCAAALLLAGCSVPGVAAEVPATAAPVVVRAVVARHVDGDTFHATLPGDRDETVRLIGVDTPEWTTEHEPYGEEASRFTRSSLPPGTVVWLETDVGLRDKYGRMLAYVWLSPPPDASDATVRAKMFNARLLVEGYAQLMTVPPDVRYAGAFVPLQADARLARRGLWGLPSR